MRAPVDHPDQRVTYRSSVGSDDQAAANAALTDYADGTVVAWQAQAADSQDTSRRTSGRWTAATR